MKWLTPLRTTFNVIAIGVASFAFLLVLAELFWDYAPLDQYLYLFGTAFFFHCLARVADLVLLAFRRSTQVESDVSSSDDVS